MSKTRDSVEDLRTLSSGDAPTFAVTNMTLDDTNLVVADTTNLQTFVEGVDLALFKARATGVSTTYVSTVAVGGTTFAQPAVSGEISSIEGYFNINYAGATGVTVADLTTESTYVYIDKSGVLQQQTNIPTRLDWCKKMFTMRIAVDTTNNTILGFEYLNNPIGHYSNSIRDIYSYLLAQGVPFKKDQTITGRAGDLGFDVSAGSLMEFGGTGDIHNANIKIFNAVSNASFYLATRTAQDTGGNTALPKYWDNAGTLTALGSTTVVGHRLYRFSNGNFVMQYGQGNYANMNLAKTGVVLEDYVLKPSLKNATFYGWWFIQSTATNTGGTTLTSFVEYTLGVTGGSSSGLSGALLKGNNLSDLLDATAARTNLGLGTSSSPTFAGVDVTGTVTADGLVVDGPFTSTGIDDNATSTAITIDASQNVTLGVPSSVNLSGSTLELTLGDTGDTANDGYGIGFVHNTVDLNAYILGQKQEMTLGTTGATPVKFVTNNVNRMTLDSAGNVGIGTSSPSSALHAKGGSTSTPADASAFLANATARLVVNHGNEYGAYVGYVNSTNDAIGIQSARSDGQTGPLSLNPYGGNLGIGTSSPQAALDINGQYILLGDGTYSAAMGRGNALISGQTASDFVIASTGSNDLVLSTGSADRLHIDSSGNVGIGTSAPAKNLHVYNSTTNRPALIESGDADALLEFKDNATAYAPAVGATGNNLIFQTGAAATERMRISSAGDVLVGKTSNTFSTDGVALIDGGEIQVTRSGVPLYLRRNGSDGDIASFYKDGTTVGSIGSRSGGQGVTFNSQGADGVLQNAGSDSFGWNANYFYPRADNSKDCGFAALRFDDIYATNGTIQTSDRNEKQDILAITTAESNVAIACKGLLRSFRWKDSVVEKGDDARIHFGIIAQDLQDAFTAEGLDAGRYAMFTSSTWWETQTEVSAVLAEEAVYEDVVTVPAQEAGFREVTPAVQAEPAYYDVDGNVIKPAVEASEAVHEATEAVAEVTESRIATEAVEAKDAYTRTDTFDTLEEAPEGATERTRLGVRYPELLSFIIAAL